MHYVTTFALAPGHDPNLYLPALVNQNGNNKSQLLHIVLLLLFLLSNSFATVIVDRNETKGNFRL